MSHDALQRTKPPAVRNTLIVTEPGPKDQAIRDKDPGVNQSLDVLEERLNSLREWIVQLTAAAEPILCPPHLNAAAKDASATNGSKVAARVQALVSLVDEQIGAVADVMYRLHL